MNLIRKLYFLFVLLTVITVSFDRGISGLVIGGLAILWIISFGFSKSSLKEIWNNKVAVLLIAFVLMYVFGMIHSDNAEYGLKILERKASFLVFPVVMSGLIFLPRKSVENVIGYFIFGLVLASLICLSIAVIRTVSSGSFYHVNEINGVIENNFLYHRLSSGIGIHAVYFSLYLAFALMIMLDYSLGNYKFLSTWRNIGNIVLIIFLSFMVFLLKSGIIAIGLFASFLIIVGSYLVNRVNFSRRSIIFYFTITVLVTVFTSFILINKVGIHKDYLSYDMHVIPPNPGWNSVNLRLAKWDVALQVIEENWLFGVGTGDLKSILDQYYLKNNFQFAYLEHFNPHNQFLQTFLTVGIMGFLILVSIFALAFYQAISSRDIIFVVFLILFGFFSITESTLATNKGIIIFTFFMSFFTYRSNLK